MKTVMNLQKLCTTIFFVFGVLSTAYSQSKTTYQKLNEVAIKLNKSMPTILDQYTQVDSLKALPPDTLQYYCKILHVNKTSESISRIKQTMEAKMLKAVRTEPVYQPYRKNKVKIVYRCYDEKEVFLFAIFLTPEKYLN